MSARSYAVAAAMALAEFLGAAEGWASLVRDVAGREEAEREAQRQGQASSGDWTVIDP